MLQNSTKLPINLHSLRLFGVYGHDKIQKIEIFTEHLINRENIRRPRKIKIIKNFKFDDAVDYGNEKKKKKKNFIIVTR